MASTSCWGPQTRPRKSRASFSATGIAPADWPMSGALAPWQHPVRPHEVAGVAARVPQEVVLVLGLRFPEVVRGRDFGHDLAGPEAGGLDVGDRVLGDAALLVGRGEDRRTVARADVVALAVLRRRVMNLEEELEDLPEADLRGVVEDLDRLGVVAVVAVGRVRRVAARVADARLDHARILAEEVLHAPEAAAGEDRAFRRHGVPPT